MSTHPESGSGAVPMPSAVRTEEESDNAGRNLLDPYITHQSTFNYISIFSPLLHALLKTPVEELRKV